MQDLHLGHDDEAVVEGRIQEADVDERLPVVLCDVFLCAQTHLQLREVPPAREVRGVCVTEEQRYCIQRGGIVLEECAGGNDGRVVVMATAAEPLARVVAVTRRLDHAFRGNVNLPLPLKAV